MCVFIFVVGIGYVFIEMFYFQVYFRIVFFVFYYWVVIVFDVEFVFFNFVVVVGWVIIIDVQFMFRIDKVVVYCCFIFLVVMFGVQCVGFCVIVFQYVEDFVFWYQVDGGFVLFFWW